MTRNELIELLRYTHQDALCNRDATPYEAWEMVCEKLKELGFDERAA